MNTINNYKNPYDSMPPPPDRIVIGPYVFEEVVCRDGKLVFPKENHYEKPKTVITIKPPVVKKTNYSRVMNRMITLAKSFLLIP